MFNSTQDDLKTQESYLGRNMQKAIENEANGRWPVGLESLQNILGKQGNMVTVDNMLLLRNHHPALFQRAKKMCHAVRTCQPKPNQPNGGCTRTNNPGVQGFNSGVYSPTGATISQPFFFRGAGYAVCGICPAGNAAQKAKTKFLQKTIDIGQPRQNVINTTDLLSFSINRSPGKKYLDIKLTKHGHSIKWDKTRNLSDQDILDKFTDLAINTSTSTVDLDITADNKVVYDSPLKSSANEFSIDFVLDKSNQPPWETNLVTFSDQRIRYFVGEVSAGQSLQEFTERIPRGKPHTQAVRLTTEDSLIVWLPPPPGSNNASNDWKERLGPDSRPKAEKISQDGQVQFFLINNYPGSFMFVKNSKQILERNTIRKFLNNHTQLINPQSLIPHFYQDTNSLRFLWNSQDNPTTAYDEGGYPEFYLDNKSEICLLLQLSGHTASEQDEMTNHVISYPTVEVCIIEPNDSAELVLAKLESDEFGFTWCKFKFNKDGIHKIGFRNTQNQRTRWVIVNVDSQLPTSDSPTYFGQDGNYHKANSGKNWGVPSAAEKREILNSNQKTLFQDISDTDFPFDFQKISNLRLGHIAEISRVIFHKHAQVIQGSKCMTLQSFEQRMRRIIYNISNLYGIGYTPTDDLTKVLKSLGEFEYWEREQDWENKHYITPRRQSFAEIENIIDVKILFDSRPYNVLKAQDIDLFTDWDTGLRYVLASELKSNPEPIILHPNELQILPSASSYIVDFWDATKDFAEPWKISSDMKELRWKIGDRSAPLPVNVKNIGEIAKVLVKQHLIAGYSGNLIQNAWLKKHDWHKSMSIEIENQRRLFISIRVPIKWDFSSAPIPPWELYLGCLDLTDMSEKMLLIDSRDKLNHPYIDELGNLGTNHKLKMPWLVDPKNSLYDHAYLTRELVRAFASICVDKSKVAQDQLNNRGIPGWVFQRYNTGQNIIHTRADSIIRMAQELVNEQKIVLGKIPNYEDVKRDIIIAVNRRFWW